MAIVYLGIGSNVGDKKINCLKAVDLLHECEKIEVLEMSSLYLTKPVGGPPQDDYINGVLKISTNYSPQKCLEKLKKIEHKLGRKKAPRNHPRVIDIDILFYDDIVFKEKDLVVPHPRLHSRLFVLQGLAEIAPEKVHPVLKEKIKDIYRLITSPDA